jgi:methyl-accepting chemotaxis protein
MAEKQQNNKTRSGISIRTRVLLVAMIPMVALCIIIGAVANYNMSHGMRQEMMNALRVEALSLEHMYNAVNDKDYTKKDGALYKGDLNVTEQTDMIDDFVEDTDMSVTLFYGDTRMATTIKGESGDRITGTQADADIVKKVVDEGEDVEKFDVTINGEKYYACYVPLNNADGTIVGMSFAGMPCSAAEKLIRERTYIIIGVEIVLLLISAVLVVIMSQGIQVGLRATEKAVEGLANGDLTTQVASHAVNRKDELGDMAKGVVALLQQLGEVVQSIRSSSQQLLQSGTELSEMASQTSATADDISKAIEDISNGAVSQADEIERASQDIDDMGRLIKNIVGDVAELDAGTREVKESSDQSIQIIQDLSASNDRSMEAMRQIAKRVNATNESAMKIRAAIDLITSIAEETNLLSLNASIEAARAGEQGKGFAVVAGQIQKLAEQSNESAGNIAVIIGELIEDSENSVQVMEEVQVVMNEQQQKLQETKSQFKKVGDGISAATEAASVIRHQTEECDNARANVVDVITNLSAISEENAASTQETTASMEELNATMNILAESASSLQEVSKDLEENIAFFRMGSGNIKEKISQIK